MGVQDDSIPKLEKVPEKFSYAELRNSTGGFSDAAILGKGGFGVVYKGTLTSGSQVAIKRMNRDATRSKGMKEFKSEVVIVSQVSHRNLIELRGYCDDPGRREYMLVYDLMPNGSLDDVLFKTTEGTPSLSWPQKVKILEGTAEGLDYLHRGLGQQVIHRDIKCSNILLDKKWNAKVADFGIARLVDHEGRPQTTQMAGTPGYIAPEVYSEQQFSDKADVFAFGVVSLELACGRRVLLGTANGLVPWVRCAHEVGRLLSTVDKRHGDYDAKQKQMVLKVGLLCTQFNPRNRPSMRVVLQMLAGVVKVPDILSPRERILKACLALFKRPERLALFKREDKLERMRAAKRDKSKTEEEERMRAAKRDKFRAAAWELENKEEEEERIRELAIEEKRMRAAKRELANVANVAEWRRAAVRELEKEEERMTAAAREMEKKKKVHELVEMCMRELQGKGGGSWARRRSSSPSYSSPPAPARVICERSRLEGHTAS